MSTTSITTIAPETPVEDYTLENIGREPLFPWPHDKPEDVASIIPLLAAEFITDNEIEFIHELCRRWSRTKFLNAAHTILNDGRRWDPGVDVCAIKSCVRLCLERAGYVAWRDPLTGCIDILATR